MAWAVQACFKFFTPCKNPLLLSRNRTRNCARSCKRRRRARSNLSSTKRIPRRHLPSRCMRTRWTCSAWMQNMPRRWKRGKLQQPPQDPLNAEEAWSSLWNQVDEAAPSSGFLQEAYAAVAGSRFADVALPGMGPEPIADSVVAAAASVATGARSAPTRPANEVPTWFTDGPNYEWRWFSRQSRPKTILCFGADADGGGRFRSWRWDCLYSGHGASVLMDPYIHHVAGHRWQDVTEYLAGTQTDSDQAAKSDACYEFRRGTTPKTRCTLSGSTLASMPPVHMMGMRLAEAVAKLTHNCMISPPAVFRRKTWISRASHVICSSSSQTSRGPAATGPRLSAETISLFVMPGPLAVCPQSRALATSPCICLAWQLGCTVFWALCG